MEESGVDAGVRERPRKKGKWTKRGSPEGGRRTVWGGWASRAVWALVTLSTRNSCFHPVASPSSVNCSFPESRYSSSQLLFSSQGPPITTLPPGRPGRLLPASLARLGPPPTPILAPIVHRWVCDPPGARMPAHHPSPLLPPLGGSSSCAWGKAPSSAPFPQLSSHASHSALWPDRGNVLGEGGSRPSASPGPVTRRPPVPAPHGPRTRITLGRFSSLRQSSPCGRPW